VASTVGAVSAGVASAGCSGVGVDGASVMGCSFQAVPASTANLCILFGEAVQLPSPACDGAGRPPPCTHGAGGTLEIVTISGSWTRAAHGAMLLGADGSVLPSIFAEMSALATATGAINLGQGFPMKMARPRCSRLRGRRSRRGEPVPARPRDAGAPRGDHGAPGTVVRHPRGSGARGARHRRRIGGAHRDDPRAHRARRRGRRVRAVLRPVRRRRRARGSAARDRAARATWIRVGGWVRSPTSMPSVRR
jgi:hypothetical protein